MSLALRVEVNGLSVEQIENVTQESTLAVARKWKINLNRIDKSVIDRVPSVVLAQTNNKLSLAGISWTPGNDAVDIRLVVDDLWLENTSLDLIADQVDTYGVVWVEGGVRPATVEDEDAISTDALPNIVKTRISEGIKVATFYAVGAVGVLATSDN